MKKDKIIEYSLPEKLRLNEWAYEGKWEIKEKHSEAEAGNKLLIRFEAKEVNLVMGAEEESRVKISWGAEEEIIEIKDEKLYNLITEEKPVSEVLEIEFLDDGVSVFAFTFG